MRIWLYCLAGLIYDWLVFVYWTAVPVRAVHLGATATQVALLQTASTTFYVLGSLWMGRVADRASRSLMARIGSLGALVSCLLVAYADSLAGLFLVMPLLGISASVFWPAVQGALGAESPPGELEHVLSRFNVTWSIGKTLGFAMAGWMLAKAGHGWTMTAAALSVLPIVLFYPRDLGARPRARIEPEPDGHPPVFRTLGYVANFAACGLGGAFQNQFFKYLSQSGFETRWDRETTFGAFLGVVFGAQTLAFWVLPRWRGWAWRRGPLYVLQLLGVVAAVLLVFAPRDWILFALAPALGISLGFSYASSIHYSLHGATSHGKYAGLHEAVLGAGSVLVPLAGGLAADWGGGPRAPYLFAAASVLVAIPLQEWLYRRSSRS
jgi:MFS family permease